MMYTTHHTPPPPQLYKKFLDRILLEVAEYCGIGTYKPVFILYTGFHLGFCQRGANATIAKLREQRARTIVILCVFSLASNIIVLIDFLN